MSAENVLYAIAFGLACGALVFGASMLFWPPKRTQPYDWERDGECDNHSHPKVLP